MKKEQKCEEILKEFQSLEQRHTKIKTKYETENVQLKEERAKYLGKYKNKLHSLKPELKVFYLFFSIAIG